MITNYRLILSCLVLSFFLLQSCKSKKVMQGAKVKKNITEIISQSYDYNWIEAKAKINFKSSAYSAKGILSMRMKKDSAVLMAVKKIGVEGGRCLIAKDSITYIDRLAQNYNIIGFSETESMIGVSTDYSYLDLLLSGAAPQLKKDNIIDSSYHKDHIEIKTKLNNIIHKINYDIYSGHIKTVEYHDTFSSGNWSFSDYRIIGDIALPYKRSFEFHYGNNESLTLDLDFSKIELDKPKPIRINIPDHYNRIY